MMERDGFAAKSSSALVNSLWVIDGFFYQYIHKIASLISLLPLAINHVVFLCSIDQYDVPVHGGDLCIPTSRNSLVKQFSD